MQSITLGWFSHPTCFIPSWIVQIFCNPLTGYGRWVLWVKDNLTFLTSLGTMFTIFDRLRRRPHPFLVTLELRTNLHLRKHNAQSRRRWRLPPTMSSLLTPSGTRSLEPALQDGTWPSSNSATKSRFTSLGCRRPVQLEWPTRTTPGIILYQLLVAKMDTMGCRSGYTVRWLFVQMAVLFKKKITVSSMPLLMPWRSKLCTLLCIVSWSQLGPLHPTRMLLIFVLFGTAWPKLSWTSLQGGKWFSFAMPTHMLALVCPPPSLTMAKKQRQ